ncbi:MAG: hypothetical protein ACI4XB_04700 [Ruminococcus sp.]
MKKTFNRLLAATVAIPVALGQVAAISVNAAEIEKFAVTTEKLLNVETEAGFPTDAEGDTITFTQVSNWNETVANALAKADGKAITVDAKAIVNALGSGYYASLIKDIVNASADPTATVSGSTITITGEADFASYMAPELDEKFAELGYEDVTIDTTVLEGASYTVTVDADLDNKAASVAFNLNAAGEDYTVSTLADYLDVVYADLSAQVEAAVDQKVKDLAAEYDMTEEEVRANADFDIDGDLAALKEITDELANKITALQDKLEKATSANIAEKTYTNADDALAAAVNFAVNNGLASAENLPTTVDGLVAQYGANFDKAVASLNTGLENAGVNVELLVSSADVASVLNGASSVVVSAANGLYSADITIEDAEYDAVVAYVEAQVEEVYGGTKEVASVETAKTIEIDATAAGTVALDIVRDVTVVLKDKDTTDTTSDTDTTDTTTTETGDTSDTDGSSDTVTTASTDDSDTSETTTDSTASTDDSDTSDTTSDTTDGTGTTDGSDTSDSTDTSDSSTTETTASTDDTTDTTDTSDSTGTTETLPTDIEAISVKMLDESASNGVYFSDEESFDAADLIESVVITLSDGTTQEVDPATAIGFVSTPAEVYATVDQEAGKGNVYFKGEVEIYYAADPDKTPLEDKPVVAVAKKGDVNFSGFVDADDAYEMLVYYATASVGQADVAFNTVGNEDALLATLAYYVADINTESKQGADDADRANATVIIDANDAYMTLVYYAAYSVDPELPDWAAIMDGESYQ